MSLSSDSLAPPLLAAEDLGLASKVNLSVGSDCRKDNRRDRDSRPPAEPKKYEESPIPVSPERSDVDV